ncbi:hypothetical protein PMI06_003128 [Burkholderia sp. BT03]|nr:hypothetical protein PMI06_003128 [Burkholderia sp. BT03]
MHCGRITHPSFVPEGRWHPHKIDQYADVGLNHRLITKQVGQQRPTGQSGEIRIDDTPCGK